MTAIGEAVLVGIYNGLLRSTDPYLFAADYYEGVFRSAEGGATWDTVFSGKPEVGIQGLVAADGMLCVGTKKGIHRSGDNGNTWTALEKRNYLLCVPKKKT